MGNSKSVSYHNAIEGIKSLTTDDFKDIKIFDYNELSMVYPISQMSLFMLERCLRDDIDNNFLIHSQYEKFHINVISRNGFMFIQVSLRPTYENLEIWLKHNMQNKQLFINIDSVMSNYYKMAEPSIRQICEKNKWRISTITKIKGDQVNINVEIFSN